MRIIIDLPDWVEDQEIKILAGMEMVAKKMPWDDFWVIKETRCNYCGDCCMDVPTGEGKWLYPVTKEGICSKLYEEDGKMLCGAKFDKPYRCLDDPLKANSPNCCITYTIQKVVEDN